MGMNTRYVKEYFYKKKIRSMFVWNLEIIAAILLAAAFSWLDVYKRQHILHTIKGVQDMGLFYEKFAYAAGND